jgi:hypothetical protein
MQNPHEMPPNDGAATRWILAQVHYIQRFMRSRAHVRARLPGERTLDVDNVLSVRGEILVLEGHVGGDALSVTAHADRLVLELVRAPEGEESTGFGWIGSSRHPKPLLRRLTEDPEEQIGHHHHD